MQEINPKDVLVLAGSIPASLPDDIYSTILKKCLEKDILCVVDATGKLLQNVLEYRPFLIKPNNHELGELFGVKLTEKKDVILYAKKLQEMGARNVLVSMAGDGAVCVTENGLIFEADAPKGELVNGVGAGDSMVAGFLTGWLQKTDYEFAFSMGLASGSASAFSQYLASKEEIEKVFEQITNKKMVRLL